MPRISFKFILIPGILILTVFSLIILKSCEKDKFQHPVVHTGEVTDITPEGAMFHGRITEMGSEEIVDHGFVLGTVKEPDLSNSQKIPLGKPKNKEFQKFLNNSLLENQTYYVRSYITEKDGATYLGRTVSFISKGSLGPEVSAVYPLSGVWRDTITIYGKRLGVGAEFVKVFIDNIESEIVLARGDSLKFIIPDELLIAQASISIIVSGIYAESENQFSIKEPEIYSVSRDYCSRGDTIVLTGFGFHPNIINNKVLLGEVELKIIEASLNELTSIHNEYISRGNHILNLNNGVHITDFPNTIKVYEPWRKLNNLPWEPATDVIGFSIDNRTFVAGILSGFNTYKGVYEYIPENDSWIRKADFPLNLPENAFTTNDYSYVMNRYTELFQYDHINNQWLQKSSIPANAQWIEDYSSFSIGNSGYVCGGQQYAQYVYFNRLLKYDELTDSWMNKKSFPKPAIYEGVGFSINGKGYVGLGLSEFQAPVFHIYEYDPELDEWSVKISLEDLIFEGNYGRKNPNVFVINNKAYIFSGSRAAGTYSFTPNNDIYEFDPETNTVIRLLDCPTPPRYRSFSFSVSGKGYIGGGYTGWPFYNDFWEFDPEKMPPANN